METCPICKVVYKLREGDVPQTRHLVAADPPIDRPVVYWEFTCPRCGIVQRRTEDELFGQFAEEHDGREPTPAEGLAWIGELGQ